LPSPDGKPSLSNGLGAFRDLIDFVGDKAVSLAVDRIGGVRAWSIYQAKHFAFAFVHPIADVVDPVYGLFLKVLHVGFGYVFGVDARQVVYIHVEWHCVFSPFR
jgi:hypothetical protein